MRADHAAEQGQEPVLLHTEQVGSGPPLIILHGFLGSGENWRTLSKRLGRRFSVYAPDQRNHGRSPHHGTMTYAVMVQDVVHFMDHHGLASVHLLGHSMGGKVAMQCAFDHPDRIKRLVVADIAPRAYVPRHTVLLQAMAGLDLDAIASRKEAAAALAPEIPDRGYRQFLLKNLVRDPETGRYTWRINLDLLRSTYQSINQALDPEAYFEGPTLFIRGGASDYITDADWPNIQWQFPNVRMQTIPEAGHWVQADAPRAFADFVWGFLTAP